MIIMITTIGEAYLKRFLLIIAMVCFSSFFGGINSIAYGGSFQYRLSQSTDELEIWTAPPLVKIFPNHDLPSETGSEVKVYAAADEFEPFQIVVKPTSNRELSINILEAAADAAGIETEIHQVKYVDIVQPSDHLGRIGLWPDPLWPLEKGETVTMVANQNTSFWFTIKAPRNTPMGDYSLSVHLGTVIIPVKLHVFNFNLPKRLHVKSQMNFSYETLLGKYGVTSLDQNYWDYVERIKQYFIDHRLTPKSVLWSGGVTSGGGANYIDYDCAGTLTDSDGIWGFEAPAARYLGGTGLMEGTFALPFNDGIGFPSFMAVTFRNNDSSQDQRPSIFCGVMRDDGDWYGSDQPHSHYNEQWIQYMAGLESYLETLGYLDKAYHYMANEPQNQDDYDAVAWYSRLLKEAAPNIKLMVSEEPKPEIYDHPDYVESGQIDIWLPVLNHYNPAISHDREINHGEETWIYWLHGTRPPFFNPITLDHPGIESRLTGWFLWRYRIRGFAYYSLANWSKNPWIDPLNDNHNGDLFMLYPPSQDNSVIPLGSNGHRLVPSIRFELMRDSLEDYEYLYLLNGGKQPEVGIETGDDPDTADAQAAKIISGVASYTRDNDFMYNLRRLIGLKIGGEIDTIPDIQPEATHPRAEGEPGDYYINFQDSDDEPLTTKMEDTWSTGYAHKYVALAGHEYLQVGFETYSDASGLGWLDDTTHFLTDRDPWGDESDERKITYVYDDYAHHPGIFEFDLPNGTYAVEISVGTPRRVREHNRVIIEGVTFIDDEASNPFILRRKDVTVKDNKLTMEMGIWGEYTMIDYLDIEHNASDPMVRYEILVDNIMCRLRSGEMAYVYGCRGVNNVLVERGAMGHLINFPGNNVIAFESAFSDFTVSRSGARVTFRGKDGTVLAMPASSERQRIDFSDASLDLYIESGNVMLGDRIIYTEEMDIVLFANDFRAKDCPED